MSMAIPKNTDIKTLAFGGSSLLGAILAGYAYTGGRLSPQFPEAYFLNFVVFAFGVYGIAFIAAPKFLLEENFNKMADGYHEAIARCMGANFLLIGYAIYDGWLTVNTYKFTCLWTVIVAIFGPTYNAFYLDCKMTPTGHAPGNILMLIAGILAVTAQ